MQLATFPSVLAAQRFIDHPLVIALIFLVVIAVGIYGIYKLNQFVEGRRVASENRAIEKRIQELTSAMQGKGLTLTYKRSSQHASLLQAFELGKRGESPTRTVWYLMESPSGSQPNIRMMDYSYIAFNGQRRVIRGQTVVLLTELDRSLPHFQLSPETQFQWAQKLFKTQDIDFAEHPQFSKIYHLQGEDESAVRALFTPQIRSFLEHHPGLSIEGHGPQVLFFREDGAIKSDQWPELFDEAHALASLLR